VLEDGECDRGVGGGGQGSRGNAKSESSYISLGKSVCEHNVGQGGS